MTYSFQLPEGYACETVDGGFRLAAPLPCPAGEARCLAVAAASWVRKAAGGAGEIRWPNHVIVDGAQICAIRCLATAEGNIVFTFLPARAALPVPEERFAEAVCRAAAADLTGYPENQPVLMAEYCEHCATVMKFVNITYRGVPVFGFAFAVDRHGGLMVMTQESRTVVTIYGGEAEIVKKEDENYTPPELPHVPGC